MIPFGHETVTLVRRAELVSNGKKHTAYTAEVLTGCSWRWTHQTVRIGEVMTQYDTITCRIPPDQTKPSPGDLMIRGQVAVTVTSGADYNALIEQYRGTDGAFVVGSVADNAQGFPLAHWAARS